MIPHPARFRLLLPTFLLLMPAAIGAHPNGMSKIAVHLIEPDSLTVTVDGNGDDFMSSTQTSPVGADTPEKKRELCLLYQERLLAYLLARVRMEIDGRRVENLKVLRWKPWGKGPGDGFAGDSLALWSSSHVVTLA